MMIMIHKDTGTDIDHNNIHVLYLYNSYNMSMIIIDVVCANDVNIYIYTNTIQIYVIYKIY